MKVSVDKATCIGCGACEATCPKVFKMKDGKSVVKQKNTKEECAKSAAESCPVAAITIS